jgi:hypothetical protein
MRTMRISDINEVAPLKSLVTNNAIQLYSGSACALKSLNLLAVSQSLQANSEIAL